jgi:hypothetical protein
VKKLVPALAVLLAVAPASTADDAEDTAEFVFARVRFNMTLDAIFQQEAPWHHDYPYAEELFLNLIQEYSSVQTNPEAYAIVDLDDDGIFNYPFLYFSEPGFMLLTNGEEENLRAWFDRGGFAMFDDFRGVDIVNLANQLKRVYPDRELFQLDVRHPMFSSFFEIDSLEMTPLYSDDRFSGGPEFWGMTDETGRLILIANQNNDLGEFWEGLDLNTVALRDAARSVELGVNYLIYSMTH